MKIYDFKHKAILRALSADARASINSLAKASKCSRITAKAIVDKLTTKYDIKFGLELNDDLIGLYQRHLIIVKLGKKPGKNALVEIFKDDIYADNVYLCEGDFDLIIHVRADDPMKYIVWESLLQGKLAEFGVKMYPSSMMLTNYGYFPIAKDTVERLAANMDKLDRRIIASLSVNSRQSDSALSRELGVNRTTLYYRIFELRKHGIIKRFTIYVNKPPMDYVLAYAVNYSFNKTSRIRSVKMMEHYKTFDEKLPLLNTFQLLAPMSGSFRFLGMAIFENESEADKGAVMAHREIFSQEKVELMTARVINCIKGSYPFRNLDINKDYTRFQWSKDTSAD